MSAPDEAEEIVVKVAKAIDGHDAFEAVSALIATLANLMVSTARDEAHLKEIKRGIQGTLDLAVGHSWLNKKEREH